MAKHIAALDLGTNSFHLIIAKVKDSGSFKVIDRRREVFRIGSEIRNGRKLISAEEIRKAIKVLREFKEFALSYDAEIYAVATSSVRESENNEEFISGIYERIGIKVNIIDGSEEARLIFSGASAALDLDNKDVFCVDVGGGSTELILRKNGKFIFAGSLPLGAVRLTNMFFPEYILDDKKISDCENYINEAIMNFSDLDKYEKAEINVGTSGTVQSAILISCSAEKQVTCSAINGYRLTNKEMSKVAEQVLGIRTAKERKKLKGMEAKRADIIPAGILILKAIFEHFKLDNLIFSDYAMREGMIISSIK